MKVKVKLLIGFNLVCFFLGGFDSVVGVIDILNGELVLKLFLVSYVYCGDGVK